MSKRDPNRVLIFDTTLRDGEQSPGCSMTQPEKLRMARALAELGVDVIEAGFPIASPGDWEAVHEIAREVRGPIIAGLAFAIAWTPCVGPTLASILAANPPGQRRSAGDVHSLQTGTSAWEGFGR